MSPIVMSPIVITYACISVFLVLALLTLIAIHRENQKKKPTELVAVAEEVVASDRLCVDFMEYTGAVWIEAKKTLSFYRFTGEEPQVERVTGADLRIAITNALKLIAKSNEDNDMCESCIPLRNGQYHCTAGKECIAMSHPPRGATSK